MYKFIKMFLNTVVFIFSFFIILTTIHYTNSFYTAIQADNQPTVEMFEDPSDPITYIELIKDEISIFKIEMKEDNRELYLSDEDSFFSRLGVVSEGIDYGINVIKSFIHVTVLPVKTLNDMYNIIDEYEEKNQELIDYIELAAEEGFTVDTEYTAELSDWLTENETSYNEAIDLNGDGTLDKYFRIGYKYDDDLNIYVEGMYIKSEISYAYTFMFASLILAGMFVFNNRAVIEEAPGGYAVKSMPGTNGAKRRQRIRFRRRNKKEKKSKYSKYEE